MNNELTFSNNDSIKAELGELDVALYDICSGERSLVTFGEFQTCEAFCVLGNNDSQQVTGKPRGGFPDASLPLMTILALEGQ